MKTEGEEVLKDAVKKLPQYAPEFSVWENIEAALEKDSLVQDAIHTLPLYTPPDTVWAGIQQKLYPVVKLQKRSITRWSAAAAVVLAIASGGIYYFLGSVKGNAEYVYSTEIKDVYPYVIDWQADEEAFKEISTFYQEMPFLKSKGAYEGLYKELAELEQAKQEIKEMAETYGISEDLVHQFKKIELERNEIAKELMAVR